MLKESLSLAKLVALFIVGVVVAGAPNNSFCTVDNSTDSGEDLAGYSLIVANAVASGYNGYSLNSGNTSKTISYLSLAFGGGTLALGVSEETSFSPAVTVVGATTMLLALVNLVQPSSEPVDGGSYNLSRARGAVIAPIVMETPGGRSSFGLVLSSQF